MIDRKDQIALARLQMSPTMQKVMDLSHKMPADMTNPNDRRAVLVTMANDMVHLMDKGKVKGKSLEGRAALHGLLVAVFMEISDGKPIGDLVPEPRSN